ncbi:DUF262 domain-containing protein [Treponema denticola]
MYINKAKVEELEKEIETQQITISYDTREYTIEIIVDKYLKDIDNEKNEFFVPDYQREFVWNNYRQSRFIESLLIGFPIPYIFLAETQAGRYEIVDGSQRIRTLAAFLNDELKISKLEVLKSLNNYKFSNLPISRQRKFKNLSLKMIVLSARTSEKTKNEIFERINRGSDLLKDMEKRKGIYKGPFNDFIYKTAKNEEYVKMTPVAKWFENRQEREELLLRYFAFLELYPKYERYTGIAKQLDNYMEKKNKKFEKNDEKRMLAEFLKMLSFVKENLSYGFSKRGSDQVSRVYFEAISVGITLALRANPEIRLDSSYLEKITKSSEFLQIISGKYHTHTPERICSRINFVKNKILNGNKNAE